MANETKRRDYQQVRGLGGFVRSSWDEVNEIIAAANVHTIKQHGPDRVIGFSPIPAMSMVSYAAGSRYLSLIGGVCMSFYDWYCDLPPARLARHRARPYRQCANHGRRLRRGCARHQESDR